MSRSRKRVSSFIVRGDSSKNLEARRFRRYKGDVRDGSWYKRHSYQYVVDTKYMYEYWSNVENTGIYGWWDDETQDEKIKNNIEQKKIYRRK